MPALRTLVGVLLAAVLGCAALVLPVYLDPTVSPAPAAFLPIMRTTVEHMKPYSLALLALVGFILGLCLEAPFVLLGMATMAAFPIWSAVDMGLSGPTSHNLWPLEWTFYGLLSFCGVLGAAAGKDLRRRVASSGESQP